MKSRVNLSAFSLILTILVAGLLIVGMFATYGQGYRFVVIGVLTIILFGAGLWYMPLSISVDDKAVNVNGSLRIRSIPLSDIADVRLFRPTMGAIRLCASGGFMGYWGMFTEGDTGRYMAFYGKASDCFMLTLRDGRKYVLGCADPDAMVDAIRRRLPR